MKEYQFPSIDLLADSPDTSKFQRQEYVLQKKEKLQEMFGLFGKAEINTYHIPPDGTFSYVFIRGMSVLFPDLKAIRDLLANQYMPL